MGNRSVTTDVVAAEPVLGGHGFGQRDAIAGRIGVAERSGRVDQCITAMAMSGVASLTAMGWVLSYAALRQLALSAGMAAWAATLWPLCVDVFVFVATLAAIADRRRGRSTSYAWALAVAYSAATVAGNVAVAGTDHVAQAVHATPAVTMVLAWHLLSRFFEAADRAAIRAVGRPPVAAAILAVASGASATVAAFSDAVDARMRQLLGQAPRLDGISRQSWALSAIGLGLAASAGLCRADAPHAAVVANERGTPRPRLRGRRDLGGRQSRPPQGSPVDAPNVTSATDMQPGVAQTARGRPLAVHEKRAHWQPIAVEDLAP